MAFLESRQLFEELVMPIEIEKKYRLGQLGKVEVLGRLRELGAVHQRDDIEENTIYRGDHLEHSNSVLRLRRVNDTAILTFKERFPSNSDIKYQREEETEIKDPNAMEAILKALGFKAALVYEKRRQRWRLGRAEIVIDELPFGLFMEIEADEVEINDIEARLAIDGLESETETYPRLTVKHGKRRGELIESRFE